MGAFLPHVFKLVNLLGLDLARLLVFNLCGLSHEPTEKCLVLDQWHPILSVISTLFCSKLAKTRLSTQEDHVSLGLGRHVTKQEDVGRVTGVTLQICILKFSLWVKSDLLMF